MSTATAPARELTPDDVLAMPDGKHYELVDGRLLGQEMSSKSSHVAARLTRFLGSHCEPIGLAYVFAECGFTCFPNKPKQMRRPDVSCVRADRLPFDQIGDGFLSIRPDLAIEVISPNDLVLDLEEKLEDYRQAGIPLVWLIYPPSRKVRVLRPEGPPTELGPDDELTGEDILPGFHCRVGDLFESPPRQSAIPTQ